MKQDDIQIGRMIYKNRYVINWLIIVYIVPFELEVHTVITSTATKLGIISHVRGRK